MNEKGEVVMYERMKGKAGDVDITVHLGVGIHAAHGFCVSILEVEKQFNNFTRSRPAYNIAINTIGVKDTHDGKCVLHFTSATTATNRPPVARLPMLILRHAPSVALALLISRRLAWRCDNLRVGKQAEGINMHDLHPATPICPNPADDADSTFCTFCATMS